MYLRRGGRGTDDPGGSPGGALDRVVGPSGAGLPLHDLLRLLPLPFPVDMVAHRPRLLAGYASGGRLRRVAAGEPVLSLLRAARVGRRVSPAPGAPRAPTR